MGPAQPSPSINFTTRKSLIRDDRDWDRWLALYYPQVEFWMPAWDDDDKLVEDPQTEISLIWCGDKGGLEDRVLLAAAGEPIDPATHWVRPELVAEVKYTGWSGSGRVRHGVYLGLRHDKAAGEVVREVADPAAPRAVFQAKPASRAAAAKRKSWHGAVPPRPTPRLVGAERDIVGAEIRVGQG